MRKKWVLRAVGAAALLCTAAVIYLLSMPTAPFRFMEGHVWEERRTKELGQHYILRGRWPQVVDSATKELKAGGLEAQYMVIGGILVAGENGGLESRPPITTIEFKRAGAKPNDPSLVSVVSEHYDEDKEHGRKDSEIVITVDPSFSSPSLFKRLFGWLGA